jgi:hypothetical protein
MQLVQELVADRYMRSEYTVKVIVRSVPHTKRGKHKHTDALQKLLTATCATDAQ